MTQGRNYQIDNSGRTLLRRPRSTNEILIDSGSRGSMPNNEKDAATFPLATTASMIASLKSLYPDMDVTQIERKLAK